MADYGVTATGFNKKDYDTIYAERQAAMEATFGQDINTGVESPEGQIIEQIAYVAAELWNVAEQAYNAFSPSLTYGVTLKNLGKLNGLTVEEAQPSTVLVTFSGLDGTTVPAGTTVSTDPALTNGVTYTFTTDVDLVLGLILDVDPNYSVLATCTEDGSILVGANTVTVIDTPVVDITGVDNAGISNVGTDAETDPQFRARREVLVASPAVSTTDAIAAGIQSIDTVNSVIVLENEESTSTSVGGVTMDPHSIKAIVQGSETAEEKAAIAQAIYDRKDPGIPSTGAESLAVTDSQGFDHTMRWDTPDLVPIYIDIETEASDEQFSSDGQDIIDAIIAYQEDISTGATIGKDVSYARLFTPINSVENHNVQSLQIRRDGGSLGMVDIDIAGAELATFLEANINVTVTHP